MSEAKQREQAVRLFVRVCRDGSFAFAHPSTPMRVAAYVLKTSPLALWALIGLTADDITKIAAGTHRSLRENGGLY